MAGSFTKPISTERGPNSRLQDVADGLPHAAIMLDDNQEKETIMKEMDERDHMGGGVDGVDGLMGV